jgi:lipoprotein-releasing system permease protein
MVGMAIGTAALMLILSVFNGFEDLLSGMLSTFNPDFKITLAKGKYGQRSSIPLAKLREIEGIDGISYTLEETSFFEYQGSQEVGIIKGVDTAFMRVTGLDSSIVDGKAIFNDEVNYALLGSGIYAKLSVNKSDPFSSIICYMPTQGNQDALDKGFKSINAIPSGVFSVGGDIDMQYIIMDIEAVAELLDLEDQFSNIEIKTSPDADEQSIKNAITAILPADTYVVKNKYEQDEAFLRIMNIEKWISYLIACLTLLIIAFNMVGSLWMLVLEKRKDIVILKSMGMTNRQVGGIFLSLGMMITLIGFIIGMILAAILYWLQVQYGLVSIPEGFLIDAYPIKWRMNDMLVVAITVLSIGYIASIIPSIRARRLAIDKKQ